MQPKKALVVSHERSGTHFLINTLRLCFGYLDQRLDLDVQLGMNFHSSIGFEKFMHQFDGQPVGNIFKSHHAFPFFKDFIAGLSPEFRIFYVYRDPRDVMTSFWNFLNGLPWDEGPKLESVGEFLRSEPSGAMLRYQKQQVPTCFDRWQRHVQGWWGAPQSAGVTLISYEELHRDFERTVDRIAEVLGRECDTPIRPNPQQDVVGPWRGEIGSHRDFFSSEDQAWIEERLRPELAHCLAD